MESSVAFQENTQCDVSNVYDHIAEATNSSGIAFSPREQRHLEPHQSDGGVPCSACAANLGARSSDRVLLSAPNACRICCASNLCNNCVRDVSVYWSWTISAWSCVEAYTACLQCSDATTYFECPMNECPGGHAFLLVDAISCTVCEKLICYSCSFWSFDGYGYCRDCIEYTAEWNVVIPGTVIPGTYEGSFMNDGVFVPGSPPPMPNGGGYKLLEIHHRRICAEQGSCRYESAVEAADRIRTYVIDDLLGHT